MMNYKKHTVKTHIIILYFMVILFQPVLAEENTEYTVAGLLQAGFEKISGDEIQKEIIGKKLIVKDLTAKSVNIITLENGSLVLHKSIKDAHPGTLTDPVYNSRAALLPASASFKVSDNNIIAKDKIRTYILTLYKKGKVYMVERDIDHGIIHFQIELFESGKAE